MWLAKEKSSSPDVRVEIDLRSNGTPVDSPSAGPEQEETQVVPSPSPTGGDNDETQALEESHLAQPVPAHGDSPTTSIPETAPEPPQTEHEEEVPIEQAPPPPKQLTKGAADARLRRVMAPCADGSFLVPPEAREMYKDLGRRQSLGSMFEKCGYCPVS